MADNGGPRNGLVCLYSSMPVLRVWGDGLAFVRPFGASDKPFAERYTGNLTAEQVADLLDYLNRAGFLGDWTPEGINPAGNYFYVGVNLMRGSRQQTFSTVEPEFYLALLDQLLPLLTLRQPGDVVDDRIFDLNELRACVTPRVGVSVGCGDSANVTSSLTRCGDGLPPPFHTEHYSR